MFYAANSFIPSYHVNQRMVERNLKWHEILFVVQNGIETTARYGRRRFFLRAEDISPMVNVNNRLNNLIGTTVIVDRRRRVVITAYRQQPLYC